MVAFGLDISHHQDLALDLARAKREGISFVFIKATEGNTFLDSEFASNLAEARRAGLLVAAYHYVRASAGAALQVAWISRHVPKDVPVILDVEANSGAIALTRDLVARLKAAGYRVPLLYLPRWYWQQIGQPSLLGLPPLWSSRYPDNVVGTLQDEWADVPAHYWNGYGGLDVAILQFTSSARIAGHAPLDANAYRGTIQQLAALLGGEVEDDMTPAELFRARLQDGSYDEEFDHTIVRTAQAAERLFTMAPQLTQVVGLLKNIQGDLDETEARILGAISNAAGGAVDIDDLAAALAGKLGPQLGAELVAALGRALINEGN